MNSHRIRNDDSTTFKSALNHKNKAEIFKFLMEAKEYILALEIISPRTGRRVPIVQSDCKTGFRGFVIDIISVTEMYREFIEVHNWLLFFATYRMSQDHLEMLFGIIISSNCFFSSICVTNFYLFTRKITCYEWL